LIKGVDIYPEMVHDLDSDCLPFEEKIMCEIRNAILEALVEMDMNHNQAVIHAIEITGCEDVEAEEAYDEVFETLTYGM